jgi:hypothetical protein
MRSGQGSRNLVVECPLVVVDAVPGRYRLGELPQRVGARDRRAGRAQRRELACDLRCRDVAAVEQAVDVRAELLDPRRCLWL